MIGQEKDGGSCGLVTEVLLCRRVITKTQLSFCAGEDDDKTRLKLGSDWTGM